MSFAEELFAESLRLIVPSVEVERNYRPDFLKNPFSGRNLELDFYLPRYKIAFEIQGEHHFTDPAQAERDALKKGLCCKGEVTLYEISLVQVRASFVRKRILQYSHSSGVYIPVSAFTEDCLKHDKRVAAYISGIKANFVGKESLKSNTLREHTSNREEKFAAIERATIIIHKSGQRGVFVSRINNTALYARLLGSTAIQRWRLASVEVAK